MKAIHSVFAAVGAALLLSSNCVLAETLKKVDGVLADAFGMTVYTFDKDTAGSGKSACTGPCAKMWPPVPATDDRIAAPYSVITREDGAKQLAYKGKPLYLYANDAKPGDRKGDKVKDVWHVVTD
ncbi:MAG: hypothetical protein AB1584_00855 [Pseudomonadota bacterium]